MATNTSAKRMVELKVQTLALEPWVDLPEEVMWKYPGLRGWNTRMRLRDEAFREILNQLAKINETQE